MKSQYSLLLLISLFLLVLITNCKEEAIVEQNNKTADTSKLTLAKENNVLSQVADSIIQKEKKDKISRLKKEHEKPYVVIDKPEKLLADKLKSRTSNKSLSKSSNNLGSYSVQNSQSCYTLEIDVWALVKYHPIVNKIVGILPKQNANWSYNQGTLGSLTYGYSKILLIRGAIYANTVYNPHDILAGADACNLGTITSYSDFDTTASGSLWGFYTDELINRDDPLDLNTALQNMYYTKSC